MSYTTIYDSVTFEDLKHAFNSLCESIPSWKVDHIKRELRKLQDSRVPITVMRAVENKNYESLMNCGFSAYDTHFGIETIEYAIETLDMGEP